MGGGPKSTRRAPSTWYPSRHLCVSSSGCLFGSFKMPFMTASATFSAPGTTFQERQFFHRPGWTGDGLGIIQMHYIYCAIYFHYYYISSDQQELVPRGWGLLLYNKLMIESKLLSGVFLKRELGEPPHLLPVSQKHRLATWIWIRVAVEEGTVWWD